MITIGAKYDGEVIIDTKIRTESAIQKLMGLENKMKKTANEAELLASKMKKLESAKIPTEEYKEVQKQIESTRAKLSAVNERMEKWVELGKSTKSNAFKSMQYDAEQLKNTMNYLQTEAQEMRNAGTAFIDPTQTAAYQKMIAQQQYLNGQTEIHKRQWQEIVNKETLAATWVGKLPPKFQGIANVVAKIGNGLKGAVNRIKKLGNGTKKANGGFKNILRTMKQMMLSMAVFQIMFKGLEYVKSGLQNLAVYSKEYNKTMSDFTSATAQLKNGLAVAFQPILNMVIPALTSMINYLNNAANAVSRFFAIMAGKSTYTKAIKQNKDYAASLDKVGGSSEDAQGSLAGFDDLNVLQKNNATGGGGATGADGSGFAEEEVGEPSDWTKAFKEAIEAGDWYGVGALLAEKVNGAIQMAFDFLNSIDWAGKGQALASGINGWVANVDWALLGQTLSTGFMGVLTYLVEFIRTLDFGEIGRAFGELLVNIDWWGIIMNLGTLIWEAICGVWDFIWGFIEGLGIVDAISGLMEDIRKWIEEKLGNIKIIWTVAWEALKAAAKRKFEETKQNIGATLASIGMNIFAKMLEIKEKWTQKWEEIKESARQILNNAKENIVGTINRIRTNLATALQNIGANWKQKWTDMKTSVINIFNGIWTGIKKVINTIIGGVEKMANSVINGINGMINALNSLSFSVPDWVPIIGGGTFSLNIPTISTVSIPRLANGGITTGSTLANIGEAGREAVLPLENNLGYLDAFADKIASKIPATNNGPIYLQIDGKTFARLINPYSAAEDARIGISLV